MEEDLQPTPQPAPVPQQGAQIYDISGNQPVLGEVPHEDLQQAVTSGKYSLPKGQEISVVDPNGNYGTVPTEDAQNAFNNGYKYATPAMLADKASLDEHSTPGEQALTVGEGLIKGLASKTLGNLAEKGLTRLGIPDLTPADQAARERANPWESGLSEAGGMGLGALTGAGEAGLIGHAGEAAGMAVNRAITGGVASSALQSVGARLVAGGARMASEMALFQADDEASKVINDVANSPGQAAANIGLSALLGGITGGAFTGLGIGTRAIANSQVLSSFSDTLSKLGSDVSSQEKMMHEFGTAQALYHDMGSEVGGANGIRAQAMKNLIPEVNEHIVNQAQGIADQIEDTVDRLQKTGDKAGMVNDLQAQADRINASINPMRDPLTNQAMAPLDSSNIYDTLNQVKKQLGEWGQFNKSMVPLNEVAFRNSSKSLGYSIKTALEDGGIWGKAGDLQKTLNSAWADAIPAMKDAESKFMTKIGGQPEVDPTKFNTYLNQNGKATSETIRQQMMGKFVDAVDKFHGATSKAYEAAGVENPFQPAVMSSLKESLNVPDLGNKLAHLWYDKLGAKGLGDTLGGLTGLAAGHATGIPEAGITGAYLGKWALGPVFSSVIKPMMDFGSNLPAFRAATSYAGAVLKGNAALTNTAANVFGAGLKTVPAHFMDTDHVEKLDKAIQMAAASPQKMFNVAGNLGTYMPDHAQKLSQTAMTAVNYLNSQRPTNPKMSPLDSDIPVSKAQNAPFYRSLAIADQPLGCFQHIKNGTLLPQDVATLKTIYPDYYNKMSQQLVSAMTDHLSDGGSIPYKTRQSMSLFLGQPMDSTMTPTSIQSIQASYSQNKAAAQAQSQPTGKTKRGTSQMGKLAENMRTPEQASMARKDA